MKCPFKKVITSVSYTNDTTTTAGFAECDREHRMAYVPSQEFEGINGKESSPAFCMLCYKQTTIGYYGGCDNGD